MNKMIGALEEWDSILDFYRPNGSSKSWYLKELKKLTPPLMWGNWNLFTESNEFFKSEDIKRTVIPPFYEDIVKFLPIQEISGNYFYIITIYAPSFFITNESIGFSCISDKYKIDIREGRCKVILTMIHEGYSGMEGNKDLETIEKWRINENFPPNSVYYFTGNLIADKLAEKKQLSINVVPVQMFENWIWGRCERNSDPPTIFNPVDDKYLYLSYNRQPRIHRIVLTHQLIKNNIFDKGLLSLNKPWPELKSINFPGVNQEIINNIINKTPFRINEKYDLNFNLACNLDKIDYEKTFISIITETLIEKDCLFLSEKIWKPIVMGHPFMVIGCKGTLGYLKSLGYKTFEDWIDESYDQKDDYIDRINLVVRELLKFSNYSITELKEIRNEMFAICEFNKSHFINLYKLNYTNDVVSNVYEKHLMKIWKKLNKEIENKKFI